MKTRILGGIASWLIAVLIAAGVVTTPVEYYCSADSSCFVTLHTSISHGSVSTTRGSPTYQDFLEVVSAGASSITRRASAASNGQLPSAVTAVFGRRITCPAT